MCDILVRLLGLNIYCGGCCQCQWTKLQIINCTRTKLHTCALQPPQSRSGLTPCKRRVGNPAQRVSVAGLPTSQALYLDPEDESRRAAVTM